jgi:hypothetical protein
MSLHRYQNISGQTVGVLIRYVSGVVGQRIEAGRTMLSVASGATLICENDAALTVAFNPATRAILSLGAVFTDLGVFNPAVATGIDDDANLPPLNP